MGSVVSSPSAAAASAAAAPAPAPNDAVPYIAEDALPATMRAVTFPRYGSVDIDADDHWPSVLQIEDVPLPEVGDKQVLVQVAAAGANASDCRHFLGGFSTIGALPAPPTTLGSDVAGVVVRVGSGCTRLRVGDRVFGALSDKNHLAFAEFVAEDEARFALKPDAVSFADAAVLATSGATMLSALETAGVK